MLGNQNRVSILAAAAQSLFVKSESPFVAELVLAGDKVITTSNMLVDDFEEYKSEEEAFCGGRAKLVPLWNVLGSGGIVCVVACDASLENSTAAARSLAQHFQKSVAFRHNGNVIIVASNGLGEAASETIIAIPGFLQSDLALSDL